VDITASEKANTAGGSLRTSTRAHKNIDGSACIWRYQAFALTPSCRINVGRVLVLNDPLVDLNPKPQTLNPKQLT
jgi:hypothetical protein